MTTNTSNSTNTSTDTSEQKDGRKQSLYMPEELLAQVKVQAARLDRSVSWVVQKALKIAMSDIEKLPSME